jgi:hypothetical protein
METAVHRDTPDELSQRAHRLWIGGLGLVLPVLLYLFAGIWPTDGLPSGAPLRSVSAYYHSGAIAVFVGVLFALALALVTYRGYKGILADRIVGGIGGAAAAAVALFPSKAPDDLCNASWWRESYGVVHYVAAAVLFLSFILFSVWLFRKSSIPKRRDRPPDKRRRDDTCLVCGIVMIVGVVWTGIAGRRGDPIFLPESIAIVAFAVSWLVKGEAHESAMNAARRLARGVTGRPR